MIRTLAIITGAGLVLALACFAGAAALGGADLQRNGWSWTIHDQDGETVRIERIRGGGADDMGPMVTRTLAWTGGDALILDVGADVDYVQGAEAGVVVTGPKALTDRVQLQDGRLTLGDGDERVVFGWDSNGPTARSQRDDLRIVVTAPAISRFELEGSSDLSIEAYDQDTLAVDISGSGEVTARGRTRTLTLDISGSGEARLADLSTTDAVVDIDGSGEARIAPTGAVSVTISGSGDVDLTTRPASLRTDISGSGDVDELG